jgi:hypothetical protein
MGQSDSISGCAFKTAIYVSAYFWWDEHPTCPSYAMVLCRLAELSITVSMF